MILSILIFQVIQGHEMTFKIEIDWPNNLFCDNELSMSKNNIGVIFLMWKMKGFI